MKTGEVTDNHKVVFMFEFVKKVDEIRPNKDHYSSKCIIRNLMWSILLQRKSVEGEESELSDEDEGEFEYVNKDSKDKDTFTVKLYCSGKSKLWCSYARVRLTVLSQKEGVENFSREFENLFSSMTPAWGYSDFIEWDKVINPENGFVKDNVLKFQAHVVADIPQDLNGEDNGDIPENVEDWLALFEKNLNDKIVGRISCEFIRMNTVIEKAVKNEEISEKIVGAAIDSISAVIRTEVQSLEKKLEKSCLNQITKIVREIKNTALKENQTRNRTNDLPEEKGGNESNKNSHENEANSKNVNIIEEETVPVSVLKIMKELIIEQQRTSAFGWMPNLYGTRAAYYRSNELHSYQPDSVRESEEFRLKKSVLQPLAYESASDSNRQSDQVVDKCLETKKGSVFSPPCETVQQQQEKKKNEEMVGNKSPNIPAGSDETTPTIVLEANEIAPPADQSEKKLLFIGKNSNGEVEMHKISDREILDLTKKYKNYKILEADEF